MPETKVRSGQLGTSLSSKTIDNTNTINTDLTKLAIAGGTNGQVLSTNGSSVLSWATAGGGGGSDNPGGAGGGGAGAGAKGGGNGMPPAMVGPMAAITGVASAIGGLAGGFMTLIEMVGKFVGSLDPALMQQLNLAFENLSAVIGTGLRPLVSMAVVVIKAFGDALVPVMKQLEPVMTKLSMVIINMVVPYILVWADQIETLIPVIEALLPVIGLFGDLLLLSMKILIPPFKVLAGVLMIVIGAFNFVVSGIYILLAAFFAATGELKSWVPGMGDSSKADKQMAKDMAEKSKGAAMSAGDTMKKGANLI